MKRQAVLSAVLFFNAFCCLAQTTPDAGTATQAPAAGAKPDAVTPPVAKQDAGGVIAISDFASYADVTRIPANIVSQCPNLGRQFSDATLKSGTGLGLQLEQSGSVDPAKGAPVLVLSILSATSAGNAFIGHRKSVSIKADLYSSGKLVNSYSMARDSMGGAFGGLKNSCDVLERVVNALGSDVAKWLKTASR